MLCVDLNQLQDFARRYTAAWCSGDASAVASFYDPDGRLTINGGAPAVGRAGIEAAARGFMTAFPDLTVLMDEILLGGEGAEYHWTLLGTNTGPGGTGKRVRIRGYEAWKIGGNGLITESQGHFDDAEYRRQLERGV
jgi:uncharacterized protein (TIGR02246 family)